MNSELLSWLTYEESLTDRLSKKIIPRLQVVKQQWQSPSWWDRYHLQIDNEMLFNREIIMWGDNLPCWYARTILLASTYKAAPRFFNRLEKESLGQLIFSSSTCSGLPVSPNPSDFTSGSMDTKNLIADEPVTRLNMIHYAINPQKIEYYWLTKHLNNMVDEYWMRLSTFTIKNNFPFFLVEILLPDLMRYVD